MKRNGFHEKPAPMIPIDRVALRVISQGNHFVPEKKICNVDRSLPIETRAATSSELCQPTFIDLTGKRFGRFVVIGISKDTKSSWVVRCSCGRYALRSSKAIKNPENVQDRCEHCRHLAFLKKDEAYRRTGRDQDIRSF